MSKDNSSQQDNQPLRANGSAKGWLVGMVAGQLLGFTAAALLAPPAAVLPVLAISTLVGGVLGGMAVTKTAALRLEKRSRPAETLSERIFEALVATDTKLGELFIEEDFNTAANNNEPAQEKKHALEHKLAPAAMPHMRPF